jgi:hypothetical protein
MGTRPCGTGRDSECADMLQTKGKTNYMGGIDVAKLNGRETETVNPTMTRTDLVTLTKLTLITDSPYPLVPALWPCL